MIVSVTVTCMIATERSTSITVIETTTCIVAIEPQNLDNYKGRGRVQLWWTTSKFKFRLVNKVRVEKQLRLLKRSKATGPDNLPPEMLKDCSSELSEPLCHLINLPMISGTIPNEWKLATVIPIFKYGDRTEPNNYRPTSLYYLYCQKY